MARPNQALQGTGGVKLICNALAQPPAPELGRSAAEGFGAVSTPDGDGVERICRLLESLPGVRVAWSRLMPGRARFGLAVSDPRTLARLVHLAYAINMPLVVEVDWSCQALYRHDDPACIRYDLRVPVTVADGPGMGLALVEELLAEEVQQLASLRLPDAEPGAAADPARTFVSGTS